jgi:hypothetical protein
MRLAFELSTSLLGPSGSEKGCRISGGRVQDFLGFKVVLLFIAESIITT